MKLKNVKLLEDKELMLVNGGGKGQIIKKGAKYVFEFGEQIWDFGRGFLQGLRES